MTRGEKWLPSRSCVILSDFLMEGRANMADVLCIGRDDAAMQTRMLILERAGHSVSQARDLRQVKAACETFSFAVAVLGQSLNPNEKKRIVDVIMTSTKPTRILELHSGIAPELTEADEHLQVSATEPEALVKAVNTLLQQRRKKARQKPSDC